MNFPQPKPASINYGICAAGRSRTKVRNGGSRERQPATTGLRTVSSSAPWRAFQTIRCAEADTEPCEFRPRPTTSAPSSSANGDRLRFFDQDMVAFKSDGGVAARRVLPHSLFDRRLQTVGHGGHRSQFRARSEAIRRAREGNIMATAQGIQLLIRSVGSARPSLIPQSIATMHQDRGATKWG